MARAATHSLTCMVSENIAYPIPKLARFYPIDPVELTDPDRRDLARVRLAGPAGAYHRQRLVVIRDQPEVRVRLLRWLPKLRDQKLKLRSVELLRFQAPD